MWVLDHLDDLDADFRVFYRIDDFEELSGPRFLALAVRAAAYQGVMAARVSAMSGTGEKVRQVKAEKTAITNDPVLSGLVSWGEG